MASERSGSLVQRSDMMTGAPNNNAPTVKKPQTCSMKWPTQHRYNTRSSAAHTPYRQLHGIDEHDDSDDDTDDQMNQVTSLITDLPRQLHTTETKMKQLQNQVPLFKGQQKKYKEFQHLLLYHIRPFQNKLKDEEKLQIFPSLLRHDAIEFWQTLHISRETTQ